MPSFTCILHPIESKRMTLESGQPRQRCVRPLSKVMRARTGPRSPITLLFRSTTAKSPGKTWHYRGRLRNEIGWPRIHLRDCTLPNAPSVKCLRWEDQSHLLTYLTGTALIKDRSTHLKSCKAVVLRPWMTATAKFSWVTSTEVIERANYCVDGSMWCLLFLVHSALYSIL